MNGESDRVGGGRCCSVVSYCHTICLEGVRKTMENFIPHSQPSRRDSNVGHHDYEAGVGFGNLTHRAR